MLGINIENWKKKFFYYYTVINDDEGDGFRSSDGGESVGVRWIGLDEIVQEIQQWYVQ